MFNNSGQNHLCSSFKGITMFNTQLKIKSIFRVSSFMAITAISLLGMPAISQAASSTEVLKPGNYVENLSYLRYTQPYVIQRLTERTYMVSVTTHNATFYVSDKGVIVFDPLSDEQGQVVLDAISSITDLPVTALVYSHYHLDHLSAAQTFVDAANEKGIKLRIIASAAVAQQIENYGNVIPAPTDIIKENPGSFTFDGLTVETELSNDTHSLDNTMLLLKEEEVLHYVDGIEPDDFLPYFRLVGVLDIAPLEKALNHAKTLDWKFLNAGHSNIGYRADIDKHLELISDIRYATSTSMGTIKFEQFIDPKSDVLVWVKDFHDAVADMALDKLRAKYGKFPRFDAVMRSHVAIMISNLAYFNKH